MDTLDKILALIKERNMTNVAFEQALGLKAKTVDSWKRHNSSSYLKHIAAIADLFGVSTDYLLGRGGPGAANGGAEYVLMGHGGGGQQRVELTEEEYKAVTTVLETIRKSREANRDAPLPGKGKE